MVSLILFAFNYVDVFGDRSSHGRYSIKKGVLKFFAIFTGKYLRGISF